jgi:hypothetical protein
MSSPSTASRSGELRSTRQIQNGAENEVPGDSSRRLDILRLSRDASPLAPTSGRCRLCSVEGVKGAVLSADHVLPGIRR